MDLILLSSLRSKFPSKVICVPRALKPTFLENCYFWLMQHRQALHITPRDRGSPGHSIPILEKIKRFPDQKAKEEKGKNWGLIGPIHCPCLKSVHEALPIAHIWISHLQRHNQQVKEIASSWASSQVCFWQKSFLLHPSTMHCLRGSHTLLCPT